MTRLILSILLPATAVCGQGYRLTADAIRVDRNEHWREWIFQNDVVRTLNERADSTGLFLFSDDAVQPRLVATVANATLAAGQFSYVDAVRTNGETVQGGATARSNDRIASRLIDGDLDTFWEPAAADFSAAGLRNWELLVDLGRLAFADSITVSFPAGDAPKAFSLFVSLGEPFPFPDGNSLSFSLVAETKATDLAPPEADGLVRQSYPIAPLLRADFNLDGQPDLQGSFLQYIRLKITESDLERHRFIGEGDSGFGTYQALSPERRGAVVHQRLTAGGFLIEIDEDTYFNDVSEVQRGPIRYFEREVPRVAEIQVWTKGDNLARNPRQRAGDSYEIGGRGTPNQATDGLYQTEWTAWGYDPTIVRGTMWLDLGATFWVDGLYAVMRRQRSGSAFAGHGFLVSDGTQLKPVQLDTAEDFVQLEEALQWHDIISAERFDNRQPRVLMFGEEFAPRKIRFVQIRNLLSPGSGARLAEMQLHGVGYPVDISLHSPPIRLTDARGNFIRKTLPRIAWSADAVIREEDPLSGQTVERIEPLDQHPEIRLDIQTRTSDQTDTNFTYYQVVTVAGNEERTEVTKEVYDEIALEWTAWDIWQTLPASQQHASRTDDDGDGLTDEDRIDLIDNDGDGLVDEDGRKLRRAPRSSFDKDGELAFVGWSEWSETYQPTAGRSEAAITSPSPRKFVQIRFKISSENPFKTARIRSFHIDLAPPLALELAGELALLNSQGTTRPIGDLDTAPEDYSPPRGINPLTPQHFSYFARLAAPDPDDPTVRDGVDEILIIAPQAAEPLGVRIGRVEVERQASDLDLAIFSTRVLKTHFDQAFALGPDGRLQDADGQTIAILPTGPDSLYLRFPTSLNADLSPDVHALVEVQFASQTFREGILFPAFARSSTDAEGFFQRVDAEAQDATELVASGTARVSLQSAGHRLINDVQIARVFTPNGDGVNDLLQGRFVLLRILAERRLDIAFYDLAGALRGRAGSDLGQAGQWNFAWDGRDERGQLVPPGIYLCRIKIAADRGAEEEIFPVHVVY
ncbi:MAG: hypothetical protein OXH63_11800 [Gemmatimonadetes bacterium]|nr:hypothetical protein [Gemmatimonadota bacterium]